MSIKVGNEDEKKEENSMSVIIKGMTMPKSCEECRFLYNFSPHYKTCGAVERELIVAGLFLVRHDKCPLREDSFDNFLSDMQNKKEKVKQSNPPEFLAKCMNIRVPDCNDCGYLNYTEKEQQLYGLNYYKKEHRCKCYDRPVYHRANSVKHDPYIYPCDECREDSFVNYYDCKRSKKGV